MKYMGIFASAGIAAKSFLGRLLSANTAGQLSEAGRWKFGHTVQIDVLPKKILITHRKPQYYDRIRKEIEDLAIDWVELLRDGSVYDI